jgi:pilus assembly protein Flp/PilA
MLTRRTRGDDAGASAVEYGLLIAAIAAVVAIIVFALGGAVQSLFTESCETIDSKVAPTASCTP